MFKLIKKNTIRKISKSKKKFISILIITLLGTGIFVGLKSTSFNMIKTLDSYFDSTNSYDIKIISSLGLTEKDITSLENLPSIKQVTGAYFKDIVVKLGDSKSVIQLNSINENMNKIEILEGRLPIQNDEIVVEPALLSKHNGIKLGDYIEVNDKSLKLSKFKIVGIGKSPLYIGPETYSGSRGITNIANGNINYYAYVLEDIIKTDYYPVIYITVKDAQNKITNSNEYKEAIEKAMADIESIKGNNEKIRYSDVFDSLNDKINLKVSEGEKEFSEYNTQLEDADKGLKKANDDLVKSKKILQKNTKELENAKIEIDKYSKLLEDKKIELQKYKKQLDKAKSLITEKTKELDNSSVLLNQNKEQLDKINNELIKAKEKLDETNLLLKEKKEELDLAKDTIEKSKTELNQALEPYNFNYEKVKNIKNYIDTTSSKKEEVISHIPKKILYYDRVVEFINKIYDTTSDDIVQYLNKYSDIIDSLIQGIPTKWKSHDIIVSFLKAIKGKTDKICNVNKVVNEITKGEIEYEKYVKQYNEAKELYESKVAEYNSQYALYEEALKKYEEANNLFLMGKQELETKKGEYDKAYSLYKQGLKEYNKSLKKFENAYNQYLQGKKEIKNGKDKWNEAYKLYLSKKDEYNKNLEKFKNLKEQFEKEVKQAKSELGKISESVWYIYTRDDDRNYSSFLDAYNSVINLSKIFPIIFYTLTVLVCMINISRMVDEDRKEIGIFKALGTENKYIKVNYLLYSFFGTIIGSIFGAILGFYLLPMYIWNAYSVAFDIPKYEIFYNFTYIILGIVISTLLVEITTFLTIRKVLNESIISLTRPKLPKTGKKVFIEKIPFVKNHVSFRNKLIIRNVFIYKKKIIMTILSTIGGTLLLLIGFSIKYSISSLVNIQYGKLNTSDVFVSIDSNTSDSRIEEILNDKRIKCYQKTNVSTVTTKEFYEVYLQAMDEPFSNDVKLYDSKTGKELKFVDGEVIISCKLSELLNIDVADTIEILLKDNSKKTLIISGISENHWGHTISMNKKTYEKEFEKYHTNSIYITLKDKMQEEDFESEIKKQKEIQSVTSIKDMKQQINNIIKPLDKIVVLLIILSGLLTIVILYNLAVINISERKKEITTLKVLGFTRCELDYYIITEAIILSAIGIIVGLLIGEKVSMYIVKSLEIEKARYIYKMLPQTYIYSAFLMVLFVGITNIFTHFGLKKIKLIEKE